MELVALLTTLKGLGFTVGEMVNTAIICLIVHTTVVASVSKIIAKHKEEQNKRFEKIEAHVGLQTQGE